MKRLYIKILFIGIVVVLLIVSYVMYRSLENYTEEVERIRHSNEVIKESELILSILKDAELGQRGFQLTSDTVYLEPYYSAIATLPDHLKKLDSLIGRNPSKQKQNVDSLKILVRDQFIIISNILVNVKRSDLYMDRYESTLLTRSKISMDHIRKRIRAIQIEEQELFGRRILIEDKYRRIAPITLLFYTVLALAGVIMLFIRIVRALDLSKEAESRLSESLANQKHQMAIMAERKIILNEAEALARMGSWKWTENNDRVVGSRGLYTILDKSNDQDISLKTFLENVIPEDKPILEKFLFEIKSQREGSTIDYRIMRGEQMLHFSLTAKPQQVSGQLEGFVLGAVMDVTERKLYEKQLRQYNAELKRSNEDLEQFAYVASHDLQEPLRKIRAFGDRLTTKLGLQLSEQGLDYISRMQGAAARMELLIEDLLSFSRVSRSKSKYELLNLQSILNEVLEDIDIQVKQEEAIVRIGEVPDFYGDRLQIKRLFQNLIANAIKFHKDNEKPSIDLRGKLVGKSEVESEAGIPVQDSQFVRITVKDNGIGFDQSYVDKIFNIFQRLNGRTAYEGTGIGLAICRKIVSNHHGYITAKSIEDVGSEFIVIIPVDLNSEK